MKRRLVVVGTAAVIFSLGAGYLAGRARAAGIPASEPMTYAGTLTDANGVGLTGTKSIQIVLWDQPSLGASQCSVGPTDVALSTGGAFQLALPNACTTAIHAKQDLWAEVVVDKVPIGRNKLGAVPFAVEADTASAAAGGLKTTIDALSARATRIVRAEDNRNGCPGTGAVGVDLMTANFSLTQPTPVSISGDIIRLYSGRADASLIIDGQQKNIGLTITTTNAWTPAHVEWAGTLAAGAHVVSVRNGRLDGGDGVADIWGCGPLYGALTALIYE